MLTDKLLRAALDSSCRLCILPDGWYSPLRQGVVWPTGPSYPEQLGLVTLTNVTNTGAHWEAANPALAARIDTAVDLRDAVSDYTVIVDFEAATLSYHGDKQELAGQGAAYSTAAAICAMAYLYSNSVHYLIISHEVAGLRAFRLIALPGALTGRHRVAGVVTVGSTSTVLAIYLDGALLSSQTVAGVPTGIAGAANVCFAINDNRANYGRNFFGKFYAAALFNRTLPTGQIAYLSN